MVADSRHRRPSREYNSPEIHIENARLADSSSHLGSPELDPCNDFLNDASMLTIRLHSYADSSSVLHAESVAAVAIVQRTTLSGDSRGFTHGIMSSIHIRGGLHCFQD